MVSWCRHGSGCGFVSRFSPWFLSVGVALVVTVNVALVVLRMGWFPHYVA